MTKSSHNRNNNPAVLRQKITDYAKELGFDLVGFSPAKIEDKYLDVFGEWLGSGFNGEMKYMEGKEGSTNKRCDPTTILPGAASVICLAINYYYDQSPLKPDHGRIARYAYGRDYHKIIGKKLKKLVEFLNEINPTSVLPVTHIPNIRNSTPTCNFRIDPKTTPVKSTHKPYVDTGPLLERALAQQAGLGFIGKNGCLITREYGSWVFLAEIITTLDLSPTVKSGKTPDSTWSPTSSSGVTSPNSRPTPFHPCANCTKCIDACPTGAIIAPGLIDARRCLAYLTIEHKGKIPPKFAKVLAKTKRIFGCDICQEVCPQNQARQKPITPVTNSTNTPTLHPSPIATDQLDLKSLQRIRTDATFLKNFAGSPLMRAKRTGLTRNARATQA